MTFLSSRTNVMHLIYAFNEFSHNVKAASKLKIA